MVIADDSCSAFKKAEKLFKLNKDTKRHRYPAIVRTAALGLLLQHHAQACACCAATGDNNQHMKVCLLWLTCLTHPPGINSTLRARPWPLFLQPLPSCSDQAGARPQHSASLMLCYLLYGSVHKSRGLMFGMQTAVCYVNDWLGAGATAFPGALTEEEQHRLAADAFLHWPEHPATTNLSTRYGPLPSGLWLAAHSDAAQADDLPFEALEQSCRDVPAEQNKMPREACASEKLSSERLGHALPSVSAAVPYDASAKRCHVIAAHQHQHHAHTPDLKHKHDTHQQSPCNRDTYSAASDDKHRSGNEPAHNVQQCWHTQRNGLSANQLLQKLRWSTLGQPYDWTARQYNQHAEQRPIPEYLTHIAARLAAAAVAAQLASTGMTGSVTGDAQATAGHDAQPDHARFCPGIGSVNCVADVATCQPAY